MKLNANGFAHHLALILVMVVTGIGGIYYLYTSHADSYGNPLSSKKICQGTHYNRTWTSGTCSKTCQKGYSAVVSNPYDYCVKKAAPQTTVKYVTIKCFVYKSSFNDAFPCNSDYADFRCPYNVGTHAETKTKRTGPHSVTKYTVTGVCNQR